MAEASVAHRPADEASVTELMTQLSAQTSRLVRDEILLAQKEFQLSAKRAGLGAGLFGTAGLLAGTGFLTVVAAAAAALALVLPVWASCLIVAALLFVAAAIAGVVARKEVQQVPPAAREVVTSVKTDIDEVKGARHDRS
ncbi:phage holin family protein [Mycolicibacterium cosmeticum]|uniref:Integral membrane protein n=1 Tax=Mycolicibacterium cosmeticum TaxID=258533 RepID=W9ATL0_MYCCO|nr:phage holin family protein [Mycolicibacterium cosmeticum]TLH68420.1 phage holin family protein [Mycolicibacterium cosmeticum]CDO09094.1 integral membrane protein [Mycolicibacterium cosmeticum]